MAIKKKIFISGVVILVAVVILVGFFDNV